MATTGSQAAAPAVVAVVMGSSSDLPVMQDAVDLLAQFGVAHEVRVVSAHRTPDDMIAFGHAAAGRGLKVIIAGAGGAAHLPGMLVHRPDAPRGARGDHGRERVPQRRAAGGSYPGGR
jgi:5-(carboxyamino)imidazole ribonucleotide mutase